MSEDWYFEMSEAEDGLGSKSSSSSGEKKTNN